ncbi:MAG: cytochrome B, partial [Inquilinus sp.]|nr:cytochrome B [Inquilinus sp.]
RVWDPLVRVFHWALVVAFAVAYLTEHDDGVGLVHEWAGYIVAGLVAVRVLWGLVGPRHARFGDFLYRPSTVFAYLGDLLRSKSKRYLGHSPAGGAMAVVLLLSLAATVATGMATLAAEDGRGPLAGLIAVPAMPRDSAEFSLDRREGDEEDDDDDEDERAETLEELHEFFSNLTLILVFAHIGGVALASFAHRENLVRAMVTGDKRPL